MGNSSTKQVLNGPTLASSPFPTAIIKVTAPGAGNPNLYAQDGLFTLALPANSFDFSAPAERLSQGDAIRLFTTLYKFKLPAMQAPRLLRLLAKDGITGASLFPGFDGIRRAIEDRRYWDQQDPNL